MDCLYFPVTQENYKLIVSWNVVLWSYVPETNVIYHFMQTVQTQITELTVTVCVVY